LVEANSLWLKGQSQVSVFEGEKLSRINFDHALFAPYLGHFAEIGGHQGCDWVMLWPRNEITSSAAPEAKWDQRNP
jgi:hypothetical protein